MKQPLDPGEEGNKSRGYINITTRTRKRHQGTFMQDDNIARNMAISADMAGWEARNPDLLMKRNREACFDPKSGSLLPDTVARMLLTVGPIGRGEDGHLWVYDRGVWRPDLRDQEVKARLVDLMGNKYRPTHRNTVVEYLTGKRELPLIESAPIAEYINFRNGLLAWATGEFYGHNEAILSTVQLPVTWDRDAKCPSFLRFLASVVDPDSIEFMQELVGYFMFSGNPFEKAIMLHGGGRNGKGTFLTVVEALLGARNVSHVSLQDLGGHRFAAAELFGKLANIAGDLDATAVRSTGKFKEVVGNDRVAGEHKGKDRFTFLPFATHIFSANVIPGSSDTTTGYLDRWIVIPFPRYFGERPDTGLKDRLLAPGELSGVAAWGVEGLRRLMARGHLDLPESVNAAKQAFARSVDPVRAFLSDCATRAGDRSVPVADLHPVYRAWCHDQGRPVDLGRQELNEHVAAQPGLQKAKSNGTWVFRGLYLTKSVEDFPTQWAGGESPGSRGSSRRTPSQPYEVQKVGVFALNSFHLTLWTLRRRGSGS